LNPWNPNFLPNEGEQLNMAIVTDFIPSDLYNALPSIRDVSAGPTDHKKDCVDLCGLLTKIGLADRVSIRLIHRHFNTNFGEIMVVKIKKDPDYGTLKIMEPVKVCEGLDCGPAHYFVDNEGNLRAYEYFTEAGDLDFPRYGSFVQEFTRMVIQRGLQKKWALSTGLGERGHYQEHEFATKRSTIMFPVETETPIPEGYSPIVTDWNTYKLGVRAKEGGDVECCESSRRGGCSLDWCMCQTPNRELIPQRCSAQLCILYIGNVLTACHVLFKLVQWKSILEIRYSGAFQTSGLF
jgi:hypothetical protein